MALWRGNLWALGFADQRGWGGGTPLLLSACMKDPDLGGRPSGCCWGPVRRPWQTVVLCFGLVYVLQALAKGSLAGWLFVDRTLWFLLLRGLPQCQCLFSQETEG